MDLCSPALLRRGLSWERPTGWFQTVKTETHVDDEYKCGMATGQLVLAIVAASGCRHMLVPTRYLCTAMILSSHANTNFTILDSLQQCLHSTKQTSSYSILLSNVRTSPCRLHTWFSYSESESLATLALLKPPFGGVGDLAVFFPLLFFLGLALLAPEEDC